MRVAIGYPLFTNNVSLNKDSKILAIYLIELMPD